MKTRWGQQRRKAIGKRDEQEKGRFTRVSPIEVPWFLENWPNVQFSLHQKHLLSITKWPSLIKKLKLVKGKHTLFQDEYLKKASPWKNGAPAYNSHIAHASRTLYSLLAVYNSRSQYQKARLSRKDRSFIPLAELLAELPPKLLNANLVTRMQPLQIQIHHEVTTTMHNAHTIWILLDTTIMTIDRQNRKFKILLMRVYCK